MTRITRHRDAAYWVHSAPIVDTEGRVGQLHDDKPPIVLPTSKLLAKLIANACPGRCNQAWRTRGWADDALAELEATEADPSRPVDEKVVLRGIPKPAEPVWCRACAERIRVATSELVDIWSDVHRREDGQLAPTAQLERVGTRVAAPSQSPAWDYFEDVATWAITWAEAVSDWLANRDRAYVIEFDSDPERPDPSVLGWKVYLDERAMTPQAIRPSLSSAAGYLVGHMSAVLSAPFAREYGEEVTELVRRCQVAFGLDELVHNLPLPCLQCDRKALQRRDGQDRIKCRACGASWTQDAYDRLSVAFRHVQERRKA